MRGAKKLQKPMLFKRFVVWKQVKAAPSNKTKKKSNKRARECLGPIGAPPEQPQESPKWGPMACQEDPCGVHKSYKKQCFLTDSWLESKSRWHQATRPIRRATRGAEEAYNHL